MKSVNIVFSCSLELYYIFSLLLFIVNKDYFVSNSVYHNINTKQTNKKKNDLHLPQVSPAMYQKGVSYSRFKIFNGLPKAIKDLSSKPKKFKIALKHCLLTHSFTVSISNFLKPSLQELLRPSLSIPLNTLF